MQNCTDIIKQYDYTPNVQKPLAAVEWLPVDPTRRASQALLAAGPISLGGLVA